MFLLPQREKVFDNLKHWSKPDCYIVDLQDGCPRSLLKTARANIIKYADDLRSLDTRILLRTNGFKDPKEFNEDIKLLSLGFIDGVMLPYINDVKDLVCLDKALSNAELEYGHDSGRLSIVPLIETVYSLLHLDRITQASDRISAIALGLYDIFLDMNSQMNSENINHVSNKVLLGAKAAGLPFIDSPFIDVRDYAGLFKDCEKAVSIGADAKMVLHPDHVEVVNRAFSISKEEKVRLAKKIEGHQGGCGLNSSGEFIGPPIAESIKRQIAKKTIEETKPIDGLIPKVFEYGLDLNTVRKGQIITCPYELTIDDSWRTTWTTLVAAGDLIETSDTFCKEIGLNSRLMPFSAILNLTLCMAVEPYSESCLLHLGLEDVIYENPAYSGDTFRCYVLIEGLRNTSNGKTSVISSKHVLVNQDSQRVLSFKRKTLFPFIDELDVKQLVPESTKEEDLRQLLLADSASQVKQKINSSKARLLHSNRPVNTHDLILHDASRMVSESENLAFSTLFRNTHPIHFNYLRHSANEIVVCGGFVMSVVLSNALKDFKQVLDQKIISCSHINKIGPNDTISSVSFVHESCIEDGLEVLTIKTIGLRNVDAAARLNNRQWPKSLFDKDDMRPADIEALIKKEMPELFHKVCMQILWKIWRPIA